MNEVTCQPLDAPPALVIFDCDGVLVNSEGPANRVLAQALVREGLDVDVTEVARVTTGLTLAAVVNWAEESLGRTLSADFLDRVRAETIAAFEAELHAVPGVHEVVAAAAAAGLPHCVASSGSPEKMEFTLEKTGLLEFFKDRLYSARQVARGKPHPDVFLLAAREMGVAPQDCVVVEDSVPGVQGAVAAGMTVFAYAAPGLEEVGHGPEHLAAEGGRVFRDMAELRALLALSGAERKRA